MAKKGKISKRILARADRLNFGHNSKNNQPINANPNTRVNVLVKRLRELIDWYSFQA